MNPMKHRYLDRWLNRMLSLSNRFWKETVPGSAFNPLRKTRNWKGEADPYLMPVRQKVEDLKNEIRKQLSNLNDFTRVENDSPREQTCGVSGCTNECHTLGEKGVICKEHMLLYLDIGILLYGEKPALEQYEKRFEKSEGWSEPKCR